MTAIATTTRFGVPLWTATARPRAVRPALSGERRTAVAVVGGGFLGLSAALHLAESGRAVTLVEAGTIAAGASGRNAGFVVPNFAKVDPDAVVARLGPEAGERLLAATGASADLVFGLIRRLKIRCDARQAGWIQPAHAKVALPKLSKRARAWADRGRPAEWLKADELAATLGTAYSPGGWIDRSGGVVHPVDYAAGLAAAAEAAGAVVHERSPVTALERDGSGWTVVTARGRIGADAVVVATNAMGALDRRLARSFLPLTVHQIATEPLPASVRARLLPGDQCVSDTARDLFTFRFDAENRLITGGMAAWPFGAERRIPAAVHARAARLLGLPDLPPIAHAWTGVAAVMPDFLPHLFELAPGLLAGIGCNGRGIAVSTMIGKAIADHLCGHDGIGLPFAAPIPIAGHRLARLAPYAFLPYARLGDALDRRKG